MDVLTNSYDAAGRRKSQTSTLPNLSCGGGVSNTYTYSFDALDRLLSAGTGTAKTIWGPNGHPAVADIGNIMDTLHWDGDALLYVTNSAGKLLQFNLGSDEIMGPTETALSSTTIPGQNIYSRDSAGNIAVSYSSTSMSAWLAISGSPSSTVYGPFIATASVAEPAFAVVPQNRLDGYTIGSFTYQGQRVYDPRVGQFISTDSFPGSDSDPSSQLPYMWNNNNPIMMQDPSGNDPCGNGGFSYTAPAPLITTTTSSTGMEASDGAPSWTNGQSTIPAPLRQIACVSVHPHDETANQENFTSVRLRSRVITYSDSQMKWLRQQLKVPENSPKIRPQSAAHMFRFEEGHVPDTQLNRAMLEKTVDPRNLVKVEDLRGGGKLSTYNRVLISGKVMWVEVNSNYNQITNGGVNQR